MYFVSSTGQNPILAFYFSKLRIQATESRAPMPFPSLVAPVARGAFKGPPILDHKMSTGATHRPCKTTAHETADTDLLLESAECPGQDFEHWKGFASDAMLG